MNTGSWNAATSHTVVDRPPAGAETPGANQLPVCDVGRDRETHHSAGLPARRCRPPLPVSPRHLAGPYV
jgi:hypothetical protein